MKIRHKYKNSLGAALLVVIFISTFISCKKMDSTYSEFIKDGPRDYPGKADSVKTFGGRDRLKLSFLLLSDPKITRAKVYWNSGKDSIEIPITRTSGIDEIVSILTASQNQLTEGTYLFDIYTFDKHNHRSIKATKLGNVYGAKYQASLLTRAIQQVVRTNNTVVIDWYNAGEGFNGVELSYTNVSGVQKSIVVSPTAMQTTITDFKAGNTFSYRTIYLPEPNAIDQFYTSSTDVLVK